MAWNEPGNQGDDKDPWSGRRKVSQQTDFEKFLNDFQQKINKFFSRKEGSGPELSNSGGFFIGGLILAVVFLLWVLSGFYIVNPPERSVVLRFGKYLETVGPGWHWIPRFIDSQDTVNVDHIYNYAYDAMMLTKDENIVSVSVVVQYRIDNARNYFYNVVAPKLSLQEATASALRQIVGLNTLDDILTIGREQIRIATKTQLDLILKRYNAGIQITDVSLQPAKAPEEVKGAFDDAIKAQEDEQRYVNQAQAYAMQVEPIAGGRAKRIMQEANAYKQQVVLRAQGDTASFVALLPQYKLAPQVMRQRMFIETMQSILKQTTKILVDVKNGNNMMYLPLNEILTKNSSGSQNLDTLSSNESTSAMIQTATNNNANSMALTPISPTNSNSNDSGGSQ